MDDRLYLDAHKVHDTIQDCVQDLVLQRPQTAEAILQTLLSRLDQNLVKNNVQYTVVLGGSPAVERDIEQHLETIAAGRGARVVDMASPEAGSVVPGSSVMFTGVSTIRTALRLEQLYGPCQHCVLVVTNPAVDKTAPAFLDTINPVAAFYDARGILIETEAVTSINGVLP